MNKNIFFLATGLICYLYANLSISDTTLPSQNGSGLPQSSLVTIKQSKQTNQLLPPDIEQIRTIMNQGKLKEAKIASINYLKTYPKDIDAKLLLGTIYYKEKNYLSAKKVLSDGLKLYPDYTDIRVLLITIDFKLKQYSEIISLAEEGLKIDPENKDLLQAKEKALKSQSAKNIIP